jgi:hypothetical protein
VEVNIWFGTKEIFNFASQPWFRRTADAPANGVMSLAPKHKGQRPGFGPEVGARQLNWLNIWLNTDLNNNCFVAFF